MRCLEKQNVQRSRQGAGGPRPQELGRKVGAWSVRPAMLSGAELLKKQMLPERSLGLIIQRLYCVPEMCQLCAGDEISVLLEEAA